MPFDMTTSKTENDARMAVLWQKHLADEPENPDPGTGGGVSDDFAITVLNGSFTGIDKPTLILAVAQEAHYEPPFKYNQVIADAYREFGSKDTFDRELQREIRRLIEWSSGGPTPPPPPPLPPPPGALPRTGFRRLIFGA